MNWIGAFIWGVLFLGFIFQNKFLSKYKQDLSRQGITGCEIARHLLDASGLTQVVVESTQKQDLWGHWPVKELGLEKSVYDGKTLFAVTEAARKTVLMTQTPVSFDFSKQAWAILRFLILPALIAFVPGLQHPALKFFSSMILAALLACILLDLPRQWDASRRVYFHLKQTGYFEIDEMVKIKKLLRTLRFEKAGQVFDFAGLFSA